MHATLTGSLVVVGFFAALHAGAAASPAQRSGSAPEPETVTLAGCLDRAVDGRSSSTGGQAAGLDAALFRLTRVTAETSSGPTGPSNSNAPGTSTTGAGATAAPPGSSSAQAGQDGARATGQPDEYLLRPAAGVALAPHVGHRIRITGTMAAAGAPATNDNGRAGANGPTAARDTMGSVGGTGSTAAGSTSTAGPVPGPPVPAIDVTGVTMLAATCAK